ncbi:hypothetical protein [Streptomyces sp. NPDC051016]|uniref:hypothetical protein n=1 Tax=Streptomyces sp. NPDC051016 TaxID=3365638 RepID=UPI003787BBBF
MASVWMKHPTLPHNKPITVPESAVPHHQAAGWEVTDAPPPKPRPKPRAADTPPQDIEPPAEAAAPELGEAAEDPAPEAEADPKPKRTRKAPTSQPQES